MISTVWFSSSSFQYAPPQTVNWMLLSTLKANCSFYSEEHRKARAHTHTHTEGRERESSQLSAVKNEKGSTSLSSALIGVEKENYSYHLEGFTVTLFYAYTHGCFTHFTISFHRNLECQNTVPCHHQELVILIASFKSYSWDNVRGRDSFSIFFSHPSMTQKL